ncbi:RNA methyltransferase [Rhabdaerophilum calidifontis]|uniref:RNA methyltransferase n=1 Tax=Rhabdaerophilum calidifontis TaxID=2604328 RepID=UPI00123C22AF|nr:RNA methyltransferase [Rhabdaerophilum calidifontis]
MESLDPAPAKAPVIILVRPQLAENIGMCARAMANFGLTEMRLVAPRDGWPQKTRMKKGAFSAAAGATGILETATLFPDVETAIADLHHVHATTARERGQAKPVEAPSAAMAAAAARIGAGQRVGILFGPERTGLSNDEVAFASAVITFPVNPEFASLNLAQAVLLTGYEWFRHAHGEAPPFAMPAESPPVTRETLNSFFAFLEGHLDRARFFWPEDKRPVMIRNLRNIVHRMDPSEQDIRTLRGALDFIARRGAPSDGDPPA